MDNCLETMCLTPAREFPAEKKKKSDGSVKEGVVVVVMVSKIDKNR
jgi:hypothetical protein